MTESVNEADAVRARLIELQCPTRLISVLGIPYGPVSVFPLYHRTVSIVKVLH